MYPGLDPAIAAALMARQRQYGQGFEGPLPAPGGPVDVGIDQAAQERRGITPLPRPGYNYRHLLGMGGGGMGVSGAMGAGMDTSNDFMGLLRLLIRPNQNHALPPGQKRMQAVEAAQRNALERVQKLQHQRRANGPYSG